ncbi:unnamed protein product [Diabrotica balteata]|uniref:Uncharacterized protein n=1 Tax=Diabrotica balteata TaxID=107213 RepID=A0A9N9T470_DIABA|nr:unnamed protein product [Diabrotica balteata]
MSNLCVKINIKNLNPSLRNLKMSYQQGHGHPPQQYPPGQYPPPPQPGYGPPPPQWQQPQPQYYPPPQPPPKEEDDCYTDDSVKDPDYEDLALKHRNRRNASCSDEEDLSVSTINQANILCESVNLLPREDYEMIPNNLIPIQSEPSDKENISVSHQKLINPDCSPNKVRKN